MKKGKTLLRRTGIVFGVFFTVVLAWSIGARGLQQSPANPDKPRADIITIDGLKSFGDLQRPPVTYFHEKHSDAVEKQNKDCSVCHLKQEARQSLKFKRLQNTTKKQVMDLYHRECIDCHNQTAAAGQQSGPVTCGQCHRQKFSAASSWVPIGMNKSLHYRHSKALDEKCERCHHEYNESSKVLFYAKGKEGTCRYCHRQQNEENRISMRKASHQACVDCHLKQLAQDKDAGPVKCGSCHDPVEQKLVKVIEDVPRMKRNQPDAVFVKNSKTGSPADNPQPQASPTLVPFNHKGHEGYNDTCRVCHHAEMDACAQCHTLQGAKEGRNIKLSQAMHQLGSDQSCIGCHQNNQKKPECAGCHTSISRTRSIEAKESCRMCHLDARQIAAGTEIMLDPQDKMLAARLLKERRPITATYPDEEIPENVSIKAIADQYGPVELPHRKIVKTLMTNIEDNKISSYFHRDAGTLCQGCHHASPETRKPPRCSSCHGKPFDENNPLRPGLMAAYHQQCMECHSAMGLKKPQATDCTGCHKKK